MSETCSEILTVETSTHAFKNNVEELANKIVSCFYTCYKDVFIKWSIIVYHQYPENLISFLADTSFTDGILKFREKAGDKGLYQGGASLKTILFHFFRNTLKENLQKDKRQKDKDRKSAFALSNTPAASAGLAEETKELLYNSLETALAAMEEQDRQIIIWRHLREKSNQEIAQLLGITPASATNRIYRCMERLRSITQIPDIK